MLSCITCFKSHVHVIVKRIKNYKFQGLYKILFIWKLYLCIYSKLYTNSITCKINILHNITICDNLEYIHQYNFHR